MFILQGWRFNSADFSVQAAGENEKGSVTLIRSPEEKEKWHLLDSAIKDTFECPELYVSGAGFTIEEAIDNANAKARLAKVINL